MDESNNPQTRRSRRSNVLFAATVDVGGTAVPVKLRNLSEQGALIEGDMLPIEGSTTVFRRNELCVQSRVAWVHGRYAGVAFATALKPHEVLRHIPAPRPRVKFDFRRPGLAHKALTSEERTMIESWLMTPGRDALGE